MAYQELIAKVVPLSVSAEAVAALAARLKLDATGETADPAVRAQLDRVVDALLEPGTLDDVDENERQSVIGIITSFLKQALELVENPARTPGWVYTDPAVLQSQGQSSAAVPPLWAQFVVPTLDGLEASLASSGARVLDIGSGTGWLAISACRVFPNASVVGLDPWGPSNELARANIADAGLEHRITLRTGVIEEFEDAERFDLIWMPVLFVPPAVLDAAVQHAADSLRKGGWLILGGYAAPPDPLAHAVNDLRAVRGGGTPISDKQGVALLEAAGLANAHAVQKAWPAPVRFVVAQRRH